MRLTAPLIALLLLACGESDPEWCSRYCDGEGRESRPVKCLECPVVESPRIEPLWFNAWDRALRPELQLECPAPDGSWGLCPESAPWWDRPTERDRI